MASQRSLCLLLVVFTGLMGWLQAYQFNVGGKEGWVLNPSEKYSHWTDRMRFQVNDTLFFKYKKGSDSVFVVSKESYYMCETEKPILKMEDGDSVFTFDRSGPFYFISGNKGNCDKGQKLLVVVLAVRNKPSSPPFPAPSPPAGTPAPSPKSPSPSLAITPAFPVPAVSPAPAPTSPSPAPAPTSPSPTASPSTLTAPTPSTPTTSSPPPLSPSAENAPTPNGSPANVNSPGPSLSSAQAFAPSVVFISSVTLAMSVCLQGSHMYIF